MPPRKSPPALSDLLARLRAEKGLSLYELSQRSGINRSNLHRMEGGKITDPSRETLNRIARALDAEAELLYDAVSASDPEALPSLPTYFRAKYRMTDQEIARVEQLVAETGRKPRRAKNPPQPKIEEKQPTKGKPGRRTP